jgi:hypothetical protein
MSFPILDLRSSILAVFEICNLRSDFRNASPIPQFAISYSLSALRQFRIHNSQSAVTHLSFFICPLSFPGSLNPQLPLPSLKLFCLHPPSVALWHPHEMPAVFPLLLQHFRTLSSREL